jgi:hypothetical protein
MPTRVEWRLKGSYPRLTETEVREFENLHGVVLPAGYRSFLITTNGGDPEPDCFMFRTDRGRVSWVRLEFFFAIHTQPHAKSGLSLNTDLEILWRTFKSPNDPRMPPEMMPIGACSGNLACICLFGDKVGNVFYWDHENEFDVNGIEPDGSPVAGSPWQNCHFVANTFSDFLESFRECPEH